MGLAHLSCLVWQAETSVKEAEEWNTGEGMRKWERCFDCGQFFHGAVRLALGWACWKMYLGRPDSDGYRCQSIGILGNGLLMSGRPEEALPVLEANLATIRRYWPDEESILNAQSSLANCFSDLGRYGEALVLDREAHARRVALLGVSDEYTIRGSLCLSITLLKLKLWGEVKSFVRDQMLPAARRSLGDDHDLTLGLIQNLAAALQDDPTRTSDDLR